MKAKIVLWGWTFASGNNVSNAAQAVIKLNGQGRCVLGPTTPSVAALWVHDGVTPGRAAAASLPSFVEFHFDEPCFCMAG